MNSLALTQNLPRNESVRGLISVKDCEVLVRVYIASYIGKSEDGLKSSEVTVGHREVEQPKEAKREKKDKDYLIGN